MNIKGYESITDVINRGTQALNPDAFEVAAKETTAVILDTRNAATFAKGFVPQAINIGIDGNFAPWVGSLIPDIKQEILLITDPGREEEVVTRLARVGYDYSIGYLKNGFEAWQKAGKPIETIESISANQLADIMEADSSINIVDVRKKTEFDSEHLTTAINAPLDFVNDSMQLIDKNKTGYVQCAGGYRSMAFISILKARGFDKLVNVEGGFKAIKETKRFSITDYMVPVSAL
jgi:rhodanese-related sulfurtransferase